MGRHGSKAHKNRMDELKQYLLSNDACELMEDSRCPDPTSEPGQELMANVGRIHKGVLTLEDVCRQGLAFGKAADGYRLRQAVKTLQQNLKAQKAAEMAQTGQSSHREKCSLVYALGLMGQPFSFSDIHSQMLQPLASDPKIIIRNRIKSPIKLRTGLRDCYSDSFMGHAVVSAEEGYHVVGPGESVIFISEQGSAPPQIELVVIRGVAMHGHWSGHLYDWLSGVILAAVDERRDVRPPGIYLPRPGCNRTGNPLLEPGWVTIPMEVIGTIDKCLEENNLPEISGNYAPQESGYRLSIGGKTCYFPQFPRGPPEAYFTSNYQAPAHTDSAFAQWALSWCTTRIDKVDVPPARYQTRSVSKPSDPGPPGGGGNFVDLSLRVVVKQAQGTMMAFQPEFAHGTTHLCDARNQVATITFSQHIWNAYLEAEQNLTLRAAQQLYPAPQSPVAVRGNGEAGPVPRLNAPVVLSGQPMM
ncbi:hypothetical protein BD779DRAFT_1473056 [Infundibulicybe gibba]|nr:hypothetical protein BD779DRAFT_1473056 [Infundibulicybe gibba]